jgi:hypothetical protein
MISAITTPSLINVARYCIYQGSRGVRWAGSEWATAFRDYDIPYHFLAVCFWGALIACSAAYYQHHPDDTVWDLNHLTDNQIHELLSEVPQEPEEEEAPDFTSPYLQ